MTGPIARRASAALLGGVVLAGCQFNGVRGLPLPGGAAYGAKTYQVTAIFRNVQDLVAEASVRVAQVPVGSVTSISLDGYDARVVMRIKDSVHLPANAVAELKQTSLLGEKYVALGPPTAGPPVGTLRNGAVIPLSRTGRNPQVEEVFAALSGLLNGGGLPQLQTISVELANALTGREQQVRDVLRQFTTLVTSLDQHRAEVIRAIDALDRLSQTLAAQRQTIGTAIDALDPAMRVLADEEPQLNALLVNLSRLGQIGTQVINASQANTVADLQALQPVLYNLQLAGHNITGSLNLLLTYPFPANTTKAVLGDYTGLKITMDLNLVQNLTSLLGPPSGGGSGSRVPTLPTLPSLPTLPGGPRLPGLSQLPKLPTTPPTLPVPSGTANQPGALSTLLLGGLS